MTIQERLNIPLNERRKIEKKVLPEFYKEIRVHRKTFEIRKDEDDIQVGDILVLREWDGEKYTGSMTRREVTYVLRDAEEYGLMEGYCIIGMHSVGWNWVRPSVVMEQIGDNNVQIANCGTMNIDMR